MRSAVRVTRSILAIAAAAAVSSCSVITGDDGAITDVSRLAVETTVDRLATLPGDTLGIRVTLTNPEERPVRFTNSGCLLRFGLQRAGAGEIGRPSCPFQADLEVELGPGESREESFTWTATHPVDVRRPAGRQVPVEPGIYRIAGYLIHPEGPMSAPVEVEVRPAVTLDVGVEPAVVPTGEPTEITARLSNHTNVLDLVFEIISTCTFAIRVEGSEGEAERLTRCGIADRRVTLGPGGRLEDSVRWTPSVPGTYTLVVQLGEPTLHPDLRASAALEVR